MRLPSKKALPDYYEEISEPMDFLRMKRKMTNGCYGSIDQFGADFLLMCRNAQTYNEDDSLIFRDSVLLQEAWETAKQRVLAQQPGNGRFPSITNTVQSTSHISTHRADHKFSAYIWYRENISYIDILFIDIHLQYIDIIGQSQSAICD